MDTQLAPDDLHSLLNEVARFADKALAPHFERPEKTCSFAVQERLLNEAKANGFLNTRETTGVSIWEDPEVPLLLQFSCEALKLMAFQNPGLAYLGHQTSLTHAILKQSGLSLSPKAVPLIMLQGHYGLGRQALARYFKAPLGPSDIALLQDYYRPAAGQRSVLLASPDWTHLLTPEMTEAGVIQFALLDRKQLELDDLGTGLGLDELGNFHWRVARVKKSSPITRLALTQSRALLGQALQMEWLGLLSIACGTTERGYQLARDYAALRIQGGKTIDQHPAVQQLLAQAKSALTCSRGLLANLCTQALNPDTLGEVAAVRAQLQPALCQAANSLLQVFGGMGYMQDTGLEKIVRDTLQLKLLTGTPIELQLFLTELERTR